MPRWRFPQPLGEGWELTLIQAHNCTNGDNTHLRFVLYCYNNNCYYHCYNINIRCEVPDFVTGFLRLYRSCSDVTSICTHLPEFWSHPYCTVAIHRIVYCNCHDFYLCKVNLQWHKGTYIQNVRYAGVEVQLHYVSTWFVWLHLHTTVHMLVLIGTWH